MHFNRMKDHGTLVIIYNLWEDDQGLLELDFDTYQHMVAVVAMGFVKDAKSHINVQGFNVYHKNRLIKGNGVVENQSSPLNGLKLQIAAEKIEGLNKERETLIDIFSEERARRDFEEANIRKKLKA
ncbi:hypothetical protein RJ640_022236 [Escallonia rubra]|uniref:Morc S5 domain-containing protein n=1 Tax=Escallonia rubra TaxID=112253 RepID=A0AA88QIL5_9ASTE|nr:hypothetical protein RJ640_022236 [Escallonia rubra]